MSDTQLAALARAFMDEHGLSRQRFAELLGYSASRAGYNTVTRWVTGKGDPPKCLPLALAELRRRLADKDG